MRKHVSWIVILLCTFVLEVRSRNLQASQAAASPGQAEPERFPEPPSETSQDGRSSRESDDRADAGPVAGALRASDPNEHTVTRRASFMADIYFVALVAGCSAVAVFGVVAAGYCFYKVQKNARAAADVDYPAYGVTGPNKEGASPTADRKLAQSAQMYHFQHQKQQMIAVEKNQANRHTSASDVDTEEEENEEGDYTVYECPGMASGGELEVKNPLFQDDRPVLPVPAEEEEEKRKRSPP
ncbi:neural proliferation differentiation and control protein 1 isoform X2 [Ixodes scapularis]|uniref:neural proliferation differentiation and control protein 1 isoform X2 n=1 Tax=Ixodes scapularis TaxID=6945 RepID=UPI001C385A9B|nr:neural proliferation differentiation and control protein 1 isoform X2 [Ixodes scapularis]